MILLLGCGVPSPHQESAVTPQQTPELARKAYGILEAHCGKCHGKEAIGGFTYRNHEEMIAKDQLRRANFAGARIYLRAVLHEGGAMPPPAEPNPLNEDDKATIKAWVFAGGPEVPTVGGAETSRHLVRDEEILQAIAQDLSRVSEPERPYMRYFTLANLTNAGVSDREIKAYSVGVSKLLNSLSWQRKIVQPVSLDSAGSLLRVDMRLYGWTEKTWQRLLAAYPYGVLHNSGVAKSITESTRCDLPFLRADWFVAVAAVPPLYHDLLNLPNTAHDLEVALNVPVERDIAQTTAFRAGLQESGVSRNNRVLERHESAYGAYWRSFDFQSNAGDQNIFKHPLNFDPSGGEIIFSLPNGLQGYMLVDGKGNRINDAPIGIVSNKENATDPVVHNGLTCMSCHTLGMRRFTDSVRPLLLNSQRSNSDFDISRALSLYLEPAKMNAFLDADTKRFVEAVAETGATVTTAEPIVALQKSYDASIDLAHAAAEVGLTELELQAKLQTSPRLTRALTVLKSAGGKLKRDSWEESYGDLVAELGIGAYRKPVDLKESPKNDLKNDLKNNGGGNASAPVAVTASTTTGNYQIRRLEIETNDLVYDRVSRRLFASIPGKVEERGNTITVIDPATAQIKQSIPIGSEPGRMAISDDGKFLYVVLEGANAIRRFNIPLRKPEGQISIGTVGIEDMKVPPGHNNWLVVAKFNRGLSPRHAGDALFIDGVERPNAPRWGPNLFVFTTEPNYAYGLYNELGGSSIGRRTISEAGWGQAEPGVEGHEKADEVVFDSGFFYTSTGRIYDVFKTHGLVGTFAGGGGPVYPETSQGRVFFLQTIDKKHFLRAFSTTTLRPIGSVEIPDMRGNWSHLLSWGNESFAFRTNEKQIILVSPGR